MLSVYATARRDAGHGQCRGGRRDGDQRQDDAREKKGSERIDLMVCHGSSGPLGEGRWRGPAGRRKPFGSDLGSENSLINGIDNSLPGNVALVRCRYGGGGGSSKPDRTGRPATDIPGDAERKKEGAVPGSEVVEEPDDVGEVDPAVAVVVEGRRPARSPRSRSSG